MSLVDRVKGLTKPDREVDALIEIEVRRFEAYKVGLNDAQRAHWKPVGRNGEVHEGGTRYHAPEYTRSIDAAVALVERVLPGWIWDVSSTGSAWMMRDDDANNTHISVSGAATPAIALILALLSHPDPSKGGEE